MSHCWKSHVAAQFSSFKNICLRTISVLIDLTLDRRHSKTLILSTIVDKKKLETEFLIAICRQLGDRWQSITLFPAILIRVRRLLSAFSNVAYPVWIFYYSHRPPSARRDAAKETFWH